MRRQNLPSHRRPPRRKAPTRHYKRRLLIGGETWSWRVIVHGYARGANIRAPDGTTTFVEPDAFFKAVLYNWGDPGDEDLPYWCCENCCPAWWGPGFKPSLVKRYIQTVIKGGRTWDATAEWIRCGALVSEVRATDASDAANPPV